MHIDRRVHHQDDGYGGDRRDRRKIPDHVEGQIGIEGLVGDVGGRADEQGVAVIGRSGRIFRGDAGGRAWFVLDHELLAEDFAHAVAQHARGDVHRRARGKADDEMDRP
jgi:hypothetical protein